MSCRFDILAYVAILLVFGLRGTGFCDDPSEKEQYNKIDFRPSLMQCKLYDVLDCSTSRQFGGLLVEDIIVDELTESERSFLSVYDVPGYGPLGLNRATLMAIAYASEHNGQLPSDGIELMKWRRQIEDISEEYNHFSKLTPVQQLGMAFYGVNTATGRFIESYSNSDWCKFGILIEPVEGDAAVEYLPTRVHGSTSSDDGVKYGIAPHQVWRVVIYGETPGRILVDKKFWWQIGEAEETYKACDGCGKRK